jgi:hypothetical protein
MTDNGDAGKKIWATEFGAPTNGPSGSHVSESTQASMLTRAFSLWTGYAWSGPLFSYQGRDRGTDRSTREDFFGLVRADWSAKPAFDAYRNAVATATGSPISTPTKTDVKVKGKGASSPRHSSILGRVSPRGSASPRFAGKVRLRVYRRAHGHWRRASPQRFVQVRSGGKFRTRLGRFGHRVLKPGTYRIRARYLGHRTVKPSASRYRKFKVRAH